MSVSLHIKVLYTRKTTLLKMVIGMLTPDKGEVVVLDDVIFSTLSKDGMLCAVVSLS